MKEELGSPADGGWLGWAYMFATKRDSMTTSVQARKASFYLGKEKEGGRDKKNKHEG
jgi:hypothetical protein